MGGGELHMGDLSGEGLEITVQLPFRFQQPELSHMAQNVITKGLENVVWLCTQEEYESVC